MFKLNGIKLGAAFLLLSSTVGANVVIDGKLIPTEDITKIEIVPGGNTILINTAREYIVEPADGGGPVTPTNDVAINSFTASPSGIVEGGFTTLAWQTQYADYCTATEGPPNWLGLGNNIFLDANGYGDAPVQIDAPGTYTLGMTCTAGNDQTAPSRVVVNVTAQSNPPTPANCDTPSITGSTVAWSTVFGAAFPGPAGSGSSNQFLIEMPRNGYKAISFNTGNATGGGGIVPVYQTGTGGTMKMSFSECPGDFAVTKPNCQPNVATGGYIGWSDNGNFQTCKLEPNKDYYLNMTFTNGVSPNTGCTGACEVKLQYNR